MDLFQNARRVRLLSHRDKYLVAEEDHVTVRQGSDGSGERAVWTVEFVEGKERIRLKSCYGTYLTATSMPVLPMLPGKNVVQRWPSQCNAASEWEPLRDGMQVRLRSPWGNFLRPHSGLPPWRNAVVTHDVPHRSKTREKVLWNVEVVEKCPKQLITYSANSRSDWVSSPSQNDNVKRVLLTRSMGSSVW